MAIVRRKCFISYYHADREEMNDFVSDFDHADDCFIARGLGQEMTDDIIDSANPDYVMSQIRKRFLSDSTVTIVLIGACTWSRRYVDWEIQSSLRRGQSITTNGLLGVKLPSYSEGTKFPPRFNDNLRHKGQTDCYARHMTYPSSTQALVDAIEAAYNRRTTHDHLIVNSKDRMGYNRKCP